MYLFVTCIIASITIVCSQREAIIGGNTVKLGDFNYNVFWRVNGSYKCGGTLISKSHVLTAGHCLLSCVNDPCNITVIAGTTNNEMGGTSYDVKKTHMHPGYFDEYSQSHNDIAILELEKEIELSLYISIAKLPSRRLKPGERTTIIGYGAMVYNKYRNRLSKYLRYYRASVTDSNECYGKHSGLYNNGVSAGQICTFMKRGVGTCHGDSGSSVVSDDDEIVGVVSYGRPCAVGISDVHTDVFYHLPYIRHILTL